MSRRYDIDWLRNLGILLLFPFHSARVFDHWDPFYVKSEELSWGLSYFIAATSYWFMPLLFWLAGSASWYALTKRTTGEYIKDRVDRLLIPLVFGLLLVVPIQGYIAKLDHEGQVAAYLPYMVEFFTNFSDLSGYFGTFTPAHLWFILYLFVLSAVAVPFFKMFKTKNVEKFHQIFRKPWVFIFTFIVIMITQALPAPGGQNPFFFFALLLMGFITSSHQAYQEMFTKIRWKALLAVVILLPTWLVLLQYHQGYTRFSSIDILLTFLRTFLLWLTLIAILGYGQKYLNKKHKLVAYMNEAAFPVYIVHQSVLVVVAFFVLKARLGIYPSFILIMLLTVMLSFGLYEWVIKRISVLRWAFGVKMKKSSVIKTDIHISK
ncbi:acyltransferase family protein [Fredinandcohnia sp. 179-A 10B2 NHS]|uniref:acyltransferase family protein n=1 Tax=Fredinandcohnia sp. 179-A 10B2 NHS TaxID=3235176 RepID=UPI0039A0D321